MIRISLEEVRSYDRAIQEWGEVRSFVIEAQPHVVMRLKRMFERISKSDRGKVSLAATPESAWDLKWVMARPDWEFEVTAPADEALRELTGIYEHRRATVRDLLNGTIEHRDFEMAHPPREYQSVAAEIILRNGDLLVADEVSLGKTCTAICALTAAETRPALVLTLTHLPEQWKDEIEFFLPELNVHVLRKGSPYQPDFPWGLDRRRNRRVPMPDVIVSNYHRFKGWAEVLSGWVKTVIYDECQELRKENSQRYAAALGIGMACDFRIGLTATPIYNYGNEIFNVVDQISPGKLGTREEFGREWCGGRWGDKARVQDPEALGFYLREQGIMLRRTRKEVGRELPEANRIPYTIDADKEAFEDAVGDVAALARIIVGRDAATRQERFQAGGQFDMKVRQATGIAKAPYVAAFVRLLVESGEKVVLFGWHRAVYEIWLDALSDLHPAMYTGSESGPQKRRSKERFLQPSGMVYEHGNSRTKPGWRRIEQFDDPDDWDEADHSTDVLILSLRAGAGLDGLQHACRTVVFGELDWSPGIHTQNIGRVRRDLDVKGQEAVEPEQVAAYFMLSRIGADPVMADILAIKRGQADGIVDPDRDLLEELQVDPEHVKKLAEAYLAGMKP